MVKNIVNLSAFALASLAALAGYLLSARSSSSSSSLGDLWLVTLACALVPFWTVRLCADLICNACVYLSPPLSFVVTHSDKLTNT
jgi:hypothetical protein